MWTCSVVPPNHLGAQALLLVLVPDAELAVTTYSGKDVLPAGVEVHSMDRVDLCSVTSTISVALEGKPIPATPMGVWRVAAVSSRSVSGENPNHVPWAQNFAAVMVRIRTARPDCRQNSALHTVLQYWLQRKRHPVQ